MPCPGRLRVSRAWTQTACSPPSSGTSSARAEISDTDQPRTWKWKITIVFFLNFIFIYKGQWSSNTNMILLAMTALLDLPRFCSHKPSKSENIGTSLWYIEIWWFSYRSQKMFVLRHPLSLSPLITLTRNLFSSSSIIVPEMEPIAQQSCNIKIHNIGHYHQKKRNLRHNLVGLCYSQVNIIIHYTIFINTKICLSLQI